MTWFKRLVYFVVGVVLSMLVAFIYLLNETLTAV